MKGVCLVWLLLSDQSTHKQRWTSESSSELRRVLGSSDYCEEPPLPLLQKQKQKQPYSSTECFYLKLASQRSWR
ncbi:hypothetical protein ACFX2I_010799 [Malus domestica]